MTENEDYMKRLRADFDYMRMGVPFDAKSEERAWIEACKMTEEDLIDDDPYSYDAPGIPVGDSLSEDKNYWKSKLPGLGIVKVTPQKYDENLQTTKEAYSFLRVDEKEIKLPKGAEGAGALRKEIDECVATGRSELECKMAIDRKERNSKWGSSVYPKMTKDFAETGNKIKTLQDFGDEIQDIRDGILGRAFIDYVNGKISENTFTDIYNKADPL